MREKAVDAIHREVLAPVVAPLGPVITLHGEYQLARGLRQLTEPFVVLDSVLRRRRQKLNHRAEGTLQAQNGAALAVGIRRITGSVFEDRGVISLEYLGG